MRLATAADAAQLAALREQFTFEDEAGETRPGYRADFERFVREAVASPSWRIWVALEDTTIVSHLYVGLIDKVPRPTRDDRRLAYLTNVYTVPGHRGRGIGSALLAAAQGRAVEDGVELMLVWPSAASIEFYGRAGFGRQDDPLVWSTEAG